MIWQSTTHVTHTEFTAGAGEGSSPVWVQAEARMSLHSHTRCSAQVPLGEESGTFLSSRSRSPPVTPGRPTSSTLSLGQLRRIPTSLRVDSTWPCQQRATWINGGGGEAGHRITHVAPKYRQTHRTNNFLQSNTWNCTCCPTIPLIHFYINLHFFVICSWGPLQVSLFLTLNIMTIF